jgi:hypothetical protein
MCVHLSSKQTKFQTRDSVSERTSLQPPLLRLILCVLAERKSDLARVTQYITGLQELLCSINM